MGTIMAPSYANCYLRVKEQHGLKQYLVPGHPNLRLFKRYIDDIGIIYDNFDNSLPKFIKDLRAAYAPLEITIKIGKEGVVFLDTELTLNNELEVTEYELHRKPCNNKTYIPANSQHPPHMLKNIIYNDLLRAHRLCNTASATRKHISIIVANAYKQGYSRHTIKRQLERAREKIARSTKTIVDEKQLPPAIVALTYNGKSTSDIVSGLHRHWEQHAPRAAKLLVAHRCHNNLKKLLVRSKAPFINRTAAPAESNARVEATVNQNTVTRTSTNTVRAATKSSSTIKTTTRTRQQTTLDCWLKRSTT